MLYTFKDESQRFQGFLSLTLYTKQMFVNTLFKVTVLSEQISSRPPYL